MAYKKLIQSGKLLETYEYQYAPSRRLQFIVRAKSRSKPLGFRRKDNVVQLRNNFRRLVASNILGDRPYLITFTFRDFVSLSDGYYLFKKFNLRMRYFFGVQFSYICVPEFGHKNTKRLHFHVLYWGLPFDLVFERITRRIADIWGHGFVDLILTDGDMRLSSYLTKYFYKAVMDDRLVGEKAYVCSRNIKRPVSTSGEFVFSFLDTFVSDEDLRYERKYKTQWLGECVYRSYLNAA